MFASISKIDIDKGFPLQIIRTQCNSCQRKMEACDPPADFDISAPGKPQPNELSKQFVMCNTPECPAAKQRFIISDNQHVQVSNIIFFGFLFVCLFRFLGSICSKDKIPNDQHLSVIVPVYKGSDRFSCVWRSRTWNSLEISSSVDESVVTGHRTLVGIAAGRRWRWRAAKAWLKVFRLACKMSLQIVDRLAVSFTGRSAHI